MHGIMPSTTFWGVGRHSQCSADLRLLQVCGSSRLPTRKAADLGKHEVCATYLVTLSACDTATGKLEGEEGVDGLAEAFLLAGAKSVVGALWDVDDSATDTLMKDFYTHLAEGEDKASALQHAKLDYLQKWGNRPPSYWAAFTLLGDGSSAITF